MPKRKMRKSTHARKAAPRRSARAAAVRLPTIGKRDASHFRKQLLSMREDLIKTVQQNQPADLTGAAQGDEADVAAQSIEKEILFELSDNERNMLDQIEAALRKMEKGAYGLCESCRKSISLPRLKALPFARYCITCQGSMEHAIIS